jgi:capsular polysaccharide biosynthesis protein
MLVLPIFLAALAATTYFTLQQKPAYRATGTYVATLNALVMEDKELVGALDILSRRTEIVTTYSEVAKSRHIKDQAADALGIPEDIRRQLIVASRVLAGTNLLEVSVEGPDPALAASFANEIGVKTASYVQGLYETYELTPLDAAAAPRRPIKPNLIVNLLIGALAGFALGVGAAFLSAYLQSAPGKRFADTAEPEFRSLAADMSDDKLLLFQKQSEDMQAQLQETRSLLITTQNDVRLLMFVLRKLLVQSTNGSGHPQERTQAGSRSSAENK